MKNKKIRVAELFAGVGGFRLGLEGWEGKSASSGYSKKIDKSFDVIWSNQWEPSTKIQHASLVYQKRWPSCNHVNKCITKVKIEDIPDHDLLVGGFPCQDYSVAKSKNKSEGLAGDKGALWWAIHKIIKNKKNGPKYLMLENVDRLLISPSSQRGRDFSVILKSLSDLGFVVEWRVINAADYGMPQKRKRVFILAYSKKSNIYAQVKKTNAESWLTSVGVMAKAFPVEKNYGYRSEFQLDKNINMLSKNFNYINSNKVFQNSGIMLDGQVISLKLQPKYIGDKKYLRDIMFSGHIPDDYYIKNTDIDKWIYLKGKKKEEKINKEGYKYLYAEGSMSFPDDLDSPARTIITGEGGSSASRFKHVVSCDNGYRRLIPIEFERLNMMPDNHTNVDGIANAKRVFFMGNALVVGVVEKLGRELCKFDKGVKR